MDKYTLRRLDEQASNLATKQNKGVLALELDCLRYKRYLSTNKHHKSVYNDYTKRLKLVKDELEFYYQNNSNIHQEDVLEYIEQNIDKLIRYI